MIIDVAAFLIWMFCISLAAYLLYLFFSEARKSWLANKEGKELSARFLSLDEAKLVVMDHAEKLARARNIPLDEAIDIVLSSDYVPGVGQLSLPEQENLISPPVQPPVKEQARRSHEVKN